MKSDSRLISSSIQGGEDRLASFPDAASVAMAASQKDAILVDADISGAEFAIILQYAHVATKGFPSAGFSCQADASCTAESISQILRLPCTSVIRRGLR